MYYGGQQSDKLLRPMRRHYSEDGSMEITNNLVNNTTSFVFYLSGDAYSAPAIWKEVHTATQITQNLYYLHRDHLGSIVLITNNQGNAVEKRQFDAWGNIVKLTDGNGNPLTTFAILDRGYTGHEHLMGVGLIHMNGRLYDPKLHRFLSPDNFVQDLFNSQNFNRYGYVLNNPLRYTDESGEFIQILIGAAIGVITNGINNAIHGQSFFQGAGKAALIGAIGGTFSFGIGQAAMGMTGFNQVAFQTLAHAHLGGVMSVMSGGSYGQGVLSGAFGSLAAAGTGALLQNAGKGVAAVGMVAGGTISGGIGAELAGGNFWDGARNGAISAGLNHVAHQLMAGSGPKPNKSNSANRDEHIGHQERAYTMKEFINANKGLTRQEIINQMENRSKTSLNSQQGGPSMRYVINPHDGRVLDMRHMLVVGKSSTIVGNLIEAGQWFIGQASGMNSQDFYSNGVGNQFYMQQSGLQNFFYPSTFTNQLQNFFYNPRVIINH